MRQDDDQGRREKLCEADSKLEWWAMILFAEVCALVEEGENGGYDAQTIYPLLRNKAKEFERLIIQRSLEKADQTLSLEDRVAALEKRLNDMQGE